MNSLAKFVLILAVGLICCVLISSFSYVPGCNYVDSVRTVNFTKPYLESKFDEIKTVADASLETLFKEESESGEIPTLDWIRFKGYLLSFKDRYPEFHSQRLDGFLALADSKTLKTEQDAAANP